MSNNQPSDLKRVKQRIDGANKKITQARKDYKQTLIDVWVDAGLKQTISFYEKYLNTSIKLKEQVNKSKEIRTKLLYQLLDTDKDKVKLNSASPELTKKIASLNLESPDKSSTRKRSNPGSKKQVLPNNNTLRNPSNKRTQWTGKTEDFIIPNPSYFLTKNGFKTEKTNDNKVLDNSSPSSALDWVLKNKDSVLNMYDSEDTKETVELILNQLEKINDTPVYDVLSDDITSGVADKSSITKIQQKTSSGFIQGNKPKNNNNNSVYPNPNQTSKPKRKIEKKISKLLGLFQSLRNGFNTNNLDKSNIELLKNTDMITVYNLIPLDTQLKTLNSDINKVSKKLESINNNLVKNHHTNIAVMEL